MLTLFHTLFNLDYDTKRFKSKRRRKKRIIFPKRRRGPRRYQRVNFLPETRKQVEGIRSDAKENMKLSFKRSMSARLRVLRPQLKQLYGKALFKEKSKLENSLKTRYASEFRRVRRVNSRKYKFAYGTPKSFPHRHLDDIFFEEMFPRLRFRSKRFRRARFKLFKQYSLPSMYRLPKPRGLFYSSEEKKLRSSIIRKLKRSRLVYQRYFGRRGKLRTRHNWSRPANNFALKVLRKLSQKAHNKRSFYRPLWAGFLNLIAKESDLSSLHVKRGKNVNILTPYQQAYYQLKSWKKVKRLTFIRKHRRLFNLLKFFLFTSGRAGRWFRPPLWHFKRFVMRRFRILNVKALKKLKKGVMVDPHHKYNQISKYSFRVRFRRRMPFGRAQRGDLLRRPHTPNVHFRKYKHRKWFIWNRVRKKRKYRMIRRQYKIVGRYGNILRGDLGVLPQIESPTVELRETPNNFYIVVKQNNQTLFDRTAGMVYPYGAPKFKGPKRRTTYAAEILGKHVGKILIDKQMPNIQLKMRTRPNEKIKAAIKGMTSVQLPVKYHAVYEEGRLVRAAFRGIKRVHIERVSINVPLSHNGLRKRKPRRI